MMALVGAHLAFIASTSKTWHYLQQADLVPLSASPWYHFDWNPTDGTDLQLLGLTVEAFLSLCLLTLLTAILSGIHELQLAHKLQQALFNMQRQTVGKTIQ